jgi:hypothetical protein
MAAILDVGWVHSTQVCKRTTQGVLHPSLCQISVYHWCHHKIKISYSIHVNSLYYDFCLEIQSVSYHINCSSPELFPSLVIC